MTVLLLPTRRLTYRTPLMLYLKHNNYKLLCLTVNVTKTKVLLQPAQQVTAIAPNIDIAGTTLENVDHFAYLGSYLSKSANIDVEIQRRIRCACFSYGRLKDRVFSERGFRTATKILVYKAETWVAHRRHVKVLDQFQQRILQAIRGVHWQDRITNARILEQTDTTCIEAHIVRSQLSWAWHVRGMPDTREPKQLLYAELSSGKRKSGGQWKRYTDQLKANLNKCEMDLQWETTTDDRAYWRRTSSIGVENLERRRITTEADKRERRKNREFDNDTADSAVCVVDDDQQSASTATNALIEHKSCHPHYHHHFGGLISSYSFARDC